MINLDGLNGALARVGGNSSSTDVDLIDLIRAAKYSNFDSADSIIDGIKALTNNLTFDGFSPEEFGAPIVTLTRDITSTGEIKETDIVEDISDKQAELDALEGDINETGEAEDNFLHEVIALGSPEAINHSIELISGKKLEDIQTLLKDISFSPVQDKVIDGIKEFDVNTTSAGIGSASPAILSKLNEAISKVQSLVPQISGKIFDDIAVDLDENITSTLRGLVSGGLDKTLKEKVLSLINDGKVDAAGLEILNNGSDFDLKTIVETLSGIDLDVRNIVNGSPLESIKNISGGLGDFRGKDTPTDYSFKTVETAEEFEAELASSTRELNTIVFHSTGSSDSKAERIQKDHSTTGFDGIQYHFIVVRDGRVQIGRPITSPGPSGEAAIEIGIEGKNSDDASTAQDITIKKLIKAAFRIVPGMEFITADGLAIQTESYPENERVPPTGVNTTSPTKQYGRPSVRCTNGRGNSGTGYPGMASPGNVSRDPRYAQPGLATDILPELSAILEYAAANTPGVSGLRTTSGRAGRECSDSGRHNAGHASDTQLLASDGRVLSTYNSDDLKEIIQFTDVFFSYAISQGFRPSVGWGDPTKGGKVYMGGTVGHYDIAAGLARKPQKKRGGGCTLTGSIVGQGVWGNGSSGSGCPSWLMGLARKHGIV